MTLASSRLAEIDAVVTARLGSPRSKRTALRLGPVPSAMPAGIEIRTLKASEFELRLSSPIGRMITPERAAAWVPWQERIPYHQLNEFAL